MTDEEIVQGILDGCSLRTFMVPDPALPRNQPEHGESYDLPHVVIKGKHFWGKSFSGHLPHIPGVAPGSRSAFCYTNSADIFCSYCQVDHSITLMRKDRYKTHEWKLIKNYKLIWDSEINQPADIVAGEIEGGAKFRIALLDSEGIWNVHPVDLPMYEKDSGQFQLKTVWESYPMFFRNANEQDKLVAEYYKKDREGVGMALIHSMWFECFYSVFPDGTYYNFYDIQRNTRRNYERFMVYSDNL